VSSPSLQSRRLLLREIMTLIDRRHTVQLTRLVGKDGTGGTDHSKARYAGYEDEPDALVGRSRVHGLAPTTPDYSASGRACRFGRWKDADTTTQGDCMKLLAGVLVVAIPHMWLCPPAWSGLVLDGTFYIPGEATRTCGEYIVSTDAERLAAATQHTRPNQVASREYYAFVVLTDGFLAGENVASSEHKMTGERSDRPGRMVWLESYCRANPLNAFVDALIYLREYLIGRGL
jgi:hypothetical protein